MTEYKLFKEVCKRFPNNTIDYKNLTVWKG